MTIRVGRFMIPPPTNRAMLGCWRRSAEPSGSFRPGHHDLDEQARPHEVGTHAGTYRGVVPIHPFVPDIVVGLEQPHVRQPHLRGQELRLVGAGHGQVFVDALEHLARLSLDVATRVGEHAANVNGVVPLDHGADAGTPTGPLGYAVVNDGHPRRSLRWSPTRSALARMVRAGFTAALDGKKLASTT